MNSHLASLKSIHAPFAAAIAFGALAGAGITIFFAILRSLQVTNLYLEQTLGLFFFPQAPELAFFFGFLAHILASILASLIYTAVFQFLGRGGFLVGAGLGIMHWVFGGVLLKIIPWPALPDAESPWSPNWFAFELGWSTFGVVVVAHLLFGAFLGACYAQHQSLRRISIDGIRNQA